MTTATWRMPANNPVIQVNTYTITGASSSTTAVWSLTLTLYNGYTLAVSYTEDGSPTATEIATGLYTAWVASTNPYIKQITATNPSAGVVVLTAGTSGIPFSVAISNTGNGTATTATTTANVGNNDWGTARNWSTDAVPTTSNDVVIGSGSVDISRSLDQHDVTLGAFTVLDGYSGKIGRFENGEPFYLMIAPTAFIYDGKGQLGMFNLGSSAISAYIDATGSPVAGYNQIYLLGSALTTVKIVRGTIGIAVNATETATITKVQIPEPPTNGSATVTLGSGLTLTTLDQAAGTVYQQCASTTSTVGAKGALYTSGSGTITTANIYGKATMNSSGTITTLNAYGTVDFTQDRTARTITNLNAYPGCKIMLGSWITLTNGIVPGNIDDGTFTVEWHK